MASILPKPIDQGPVRANWFYQPSTRIGGDAFGYQMQDRRHFSLFLLDVSGHGTGAAMHAMTVAQVLRERVLPEVDFLDPAAVIAGLNARFQMHRNNDLFFTIWYGVYDIVDRVLIFASAGHHPACLLPADNVPGRRFRGTQNPIVGMLPDPRSPRPRSRCPPAAHCICSATACSRSSIAAGNSAWTISLRCCRRRPIVGAGDTTARDEPKSLSDRIRAIARPAIWTTIFPRWCSASHSGPNAPTCRLLGRFPCLTVNHDEIMSSFSAIQRFIALPLSKSPVKQPERLRSGITAQRPRG